MSQEATSLTPLQPTESIHALDVMRGVVCIIIFTGVGFALFGKLQRFELLYVVFSIWNFQLILSPIWLRYFHFGPMEWLWRNLSYQKMHPILKEYSKPVAPPVPMGIK